MDTKFKQTEIGEIPQEWSASSVSSIAEIISGGTPKTTVKEYWEGDIPWLSVVDFNNDQRHVYDTEKYITEEGLLNSSTTVLKKGMLIISARGTVGAIAQLGRDMAFNQSCYGLTAKNDSNNDFLYYALKNCINSIKQKAHGSIFSTITINTFNDIYLPLPSYEEQRQITSILSSLDDKIELNRKMNKTLDVMAKAIFKHWFVDFEFPNEDGKPYKSGGGEMVESELGPIPNGWDVQSFKHYISATCPGDWGNESKSGHFSEEVLCIRGADIVDLRMGNNGKLPLRYIKSKNLDQKRLDKDDIVIEMSGGSPTQSTGRTLMVTQSLLYKFQRPLICSNFCKVLRPKAAPEFVFYYLQFIYEQDELFQWENGTTGIKNLDIDGFIANYKIVLPPKALLDKYAQIASICMNGIQINGNNNTILTLIRDSLLPKLMSGRIRV